MFSTYYTLAPTNDPCTVKQYSIYKSTNPLVPWPASDPQVTLVGSLGTYKLKIDLTIRFTDTTKIYLRSTTRGLVTLD